MSTGLVGPRFLCGRRGRPDVCNSLSRRQGASHATHLEDFVAQLLSSAFIDIEAPGTVHALTFEEAHLPSDWAWWSPRNPHSNYGGLTQYAHHQHRHHVHISHRMPESLGRPFTGRQWLDQSPVATNALLSRAER